MSLSNCNPKILVSIFWCGLARAAAVKCDFIHYWPTSIWYNVEIELARQLVEQVIKSENKNFKNLNFHVAGITKPQKQHLQGFNSCEGKMKLEFGSLPLQLTWSYRILTLKSYLTAFPSRIVTFIFCMLIVL